MVTTVMIRILKRKQTIINHDNNEYNSYYMHLNMVQSKDQEAKTHNHKLYTMCRIPKFRLNSDQCH